MWHACGTYSVESFLEGKGDRARTLYERFADLVGRCGPYLVAPAKTRIAFMAKVRFASITRIGPRGMTVNIELPRPLDSPRISKVEFYGGGWWGHRIHVRSPEDLDDEILEWLRESYDMMGLRKHLERRAIRPDSK